MSIKISEDDQTLNFNSPSENINKKIIISGEKESVENDQIKLHNDIYDKYITYIRINKTMDENYFKILLAIFYRETYNKTVTWKNIPDEPDVQINLNGILNNVSFINAYDILDYYNSKNDTFKNENIIDLVALLYSTLYFFIKNEFTM